MNQEKLKELFRQKKTVRFIIVLGLIGILLIFLSEFMPKKQASNGKSDAAETSANVTISQYEEKMEQKVLNLVSSISGCGRASVVVTLETGVENVYAREEKGTTDHTQDQQGEDVKTQERNNTESKLILIEGENGQKQALVETQRQPTVKGVVVVCEGGEDALVKERIVQAVTTALGVSSNKVCVTKIS